MRRQLLGQQDVGGPVTLHDPVRHDRFGGPFRPDLLLGLAEGQRLGLGEDVRRQDVVVVAEGVEGLAEPDEVDRDQPGPLVDELVEAVLSVGAGFAPVNGAGVVVDHSAVKGHVLAVRLHRELLQVGREPLQVLLVGHDADRLGAKEVHVPDGQQAHEHGQVAFAAVWS